MVVEFEPSCATCEGGGYYVNKASGDMPHVHIMDQLFLDCVGECSLNI